MLTFWPSSSLDRGVAPSLVVPVLFHGKPKGWPIATIRMQPRASLASVNIVVSSPCPLSLSSPIFARRRARTVVWQISSAVSQSSIGRSGFWGARVGCWLWSASKCTRKRCDESGVLPVRRTIDHRKGVDRAASILRRG